MNKAPLVENGIVVGTSSDRHSSKNPVIQFIQGLFDQSISTLTQSVKADKILEVGCGEGHVTQILLDNSDANIHAMDISQTIIDIARQNIDSQRVTFEQRNIYDLESVEAADLVVCCEVLEHIDDPEKGLKLLAEKAKPYALVSVPREPLWCFLNMARGTYFSDFGNSPGHIQHWSQKAFISFVEKEFEVVKLKAPIPWTVLLLKVKT